VSIFPSIAALLFSVLLLIGGNSLVGVATPLRARIEGFPDLTVGLLGSVYFAGMLAGTLAAPAIIRRGGHIRAYAAFVALAVVSVILMPVMLFPFAWLACRALIGFVFAGLYAVIESWINAKATNANRGALYARKFRRFRQRPIGPEAARAKWLFPLRRRRGAAGARHRADGDDQRRSARSAAKRAPPPHLARAHGAGIVLRGAGRRRRQRRLVRARPGIRGRRFHTAAFRPSLRFLRRPASRFRRGNFPLLLLLR